MGQDVYWKGVLLSFRGGFEKVDLCGRGKDLCWARELRGVYISAGMGK